jgi:hypothetical protein
MRIRDADEMVFIDAKLNLKIGFPKGILNCGLPTCDQCVTQV